VESACKATELLAHEALLHCAQNATGGERSEHAVGL